MKVRTRLTSLSTIAAAAALLGAAVFSPAFANGSDSKPGEDIPGPIPAPVQKHFVEYIFSANETYPMTVSITDTFLTYDGCNTFGLDGPFRSTMPSDYEYPPVQFVIADLYVIQTELGCDPLEKPREVTVVSEAFIIDGPGTHLLYPSHMELLFVSEPGDPDDGKPTDPVEPIDPK